MRPLHRSTPSSLPFHRPAPLLSLLLLGSALACGGSGGGGAGAPPEGLEIFPPAVQLADATTTELVATATYADGSSEDVTDRVQWSLSDGSLAQLGSGLEAGQVTALAPGGGTIEATLAGVVTSAPLQVTDATLDALELAPSLELAAAGSFVEAASVGAFSDTSAQDLSGQTVWLSSDASILAPVQALGGPTLFTALRAGTVTLQGTALGTSSVVSVTVTDAALVTLETTPRSLLLPAGTSSALTVHATFADGHVQPLGQELTWTSSAPDVAGVTVVDGVSRVAALAPGSAGLTVSFGASSTTLDVTVTSPQLLSLQVDADEVAPLAGASVRLTATGIFGDGTRLDLTDEVLWSSSDPTVASVSNAAGRAGWTTTAAAGRTTLQALLPQGSTGDGSDGATFDVVGELDLDVSAAALTALSIDPPTPTLAAGLSLDLEATGLFSDGTARTRTEQVLWSSSDASVATVSNVEGRRGRLQALQPGTATLSAAEGTVQISVTLEVRAATLVDLSLQPSLPTVTVDGTTDLVAQGTYTDATTVDLTETVVWSSAAPEVAAVSNAAGQRGRVSGLAAGSATVSASLTPEGGTPVVAEREVEVLAVTLTSLAIDPPLPTVSAGSSLSLAATGTYSDGSSVDLTDEVTWESLAPEVVSISNVAGRAGQLTGRTPGQAGLRAYHGSIVGSAACTVSDAVLTGLDLLPATAVVAAGRTVQFSVLGTYSDGSSQALDETAVWSSDAPTVAVLSNATGTRGLATGLTPGAASVSATVGGLTVSAALSVGAAELVTLELTPDEAALAVGSMLTATAEGVYSDGMRLDLTEAVNWSSDDAAVASVQNGAEAGRVDALALGSTTLRANLEGIEGTAALTVTPAALTSIELTPDEASLGVAETLTFTATGHYSDGSTLDLSTLATWSTSDDSIASASNVAGSEGLVTGLSFGLIFVQAGLDGIQGMAFVIVVP